MTILAPHIEQTDDTCWGDTRIQGTRIPTRCIAGRHSAGDSVEHLVRDYGITEEQVEAAIEWERDHPTPRPPWDGADDEEDAWRMGVAWMRERVFEALEGWRDAPDYEAITTAIAGIEVPGEDDA